MWIDGTKLKLLIAERGITIKVLCAESGITQPAMSKLLKGNHKPRYATFGKLAKALNVPVAEIVDLTRFDKVDSQTLIPQNKEMFKD
jgi:transcriptional regulator with XRE-family HTH domain